VRVQASTPNANIPTQSKQSQWAQQTPPGCYRIWRLQSGHRSLSGVGEMNPHTKKARPYLLPLPIGGKIR